MTIAWDMGTDLGENVIIDTDNDIEFADTLEPWGFTLSVANAHLSIASFVTLAVDNDKRLQTTYPTHTRSNKQASVTADGAVNPAYTSSDTTVATVDRNGYIRHVDNGTATITATCRGKERSEAITLSGLPVIDYGYAPNVSYVIIGHIDGWVRKHICESLDSRLTDGSNKAIYTTLDHSTPTYVRNVNCWMADVDLTCITPWNSTGAHLRGGVLITPCHMLFAAHYPISVGATVRFVAADNTVITRTVESRLFHNDETYGQTDLALLKFTEDVPASISFCKCLPSNFRDYIIYPDKDIPCFIADRDENALVSELSVLSTIVGTGEAPGTASIQTPSDVTRLLYHKTLISGDSGSPIFLVINGELVILYCAFTSYSGPSVHGWYDAINEGLVQLGGGYTLTPIDLSSFMSVT